MEHKLVINTQMELAQMENLLRKQYEQYYMSQESMDIINQKYHDLKNQLIIIRNEKDVDKREQHIQNLENEIKRYEAQYKTGNQVLDTLLTSKTLACIEQKINVTCIADGNLLDFISTMDLCSIFGNALDNAIEGVTSIEDEGKRLIKLAVFSQNDLLLIRFENYYVNTLSYNNGNLVTTKQNMKYHGYGIKSIRSIVEKYDGSVCINTENNWFKLIILIPIPK
jgi:sensor histidine kinase regulating citrate/malate metabolism